MVTRRMVLAGGAAAVVAAGGAGIGFGYESAIRSAIVRVSQGSAVFHSRFGALEYADVGKGRPILMIHGTGGGFDQGLGFAQPLIEAGYRIIAPSRFGYLRSDFPSKASSENQADAFVDLLDYLRIETIPVVGGSAGVLAAIAFAIRHPQRCSALIALVPASYVPDRPRTPGPQGFEEKAMLAMLRSDFLFWAALKTTPDTMIASMLATDPELVHAATPDERRRVERILWEILPVSRRSRGLVNDARLAGNPGPMAIEEIRAPTLAISLEDDRFGTIAAARYLAAMVPGARLVSYPTGGHVFVGHNADVFAEVDGFLKSVAV